DDSADPTDRTVTLDTATAPGSGILSGTITGLTPAAISYPTTSVGSLSIQTGTGTETVNVRALNVPNNWLEAGSNSTPFDWGGAGGVGGVRPTLHVVGRPLSSGGWAQPRLVVDDSADATRQSITVAPLQLPNTGYYSFLPLGMPVPYDLIGGFSG